MKNSTDAHITSTSLWGMMMNKIQMSKCINRLTCGNELLYCSRVYVNARLYPTGWKEMEWLLDTVFYLVRGDKRHVYDSYLWERKHNVEKKKAQSL